MHCGVHTSMVQIMSFVWKPSSDTPVSMNIKIEVQGNGAMLLPLVPVFNVLKSYGCLKIIDLLSRTALICYNLWESETSLVSRVFLVSLGF